MKTFFSYQKLWYIENEIPIKPHLHEGGFTNGTAHECAVKMYLI